MFDSLRKLTLSAFHKDPDNDAANAERLDYPASRLPHSTLAVARAARLDYPACPPLQ